MTPKNEVHSKDNIEIRDEKTGLISCEDCPAHCCNYVTIIIEGPKSEMGIDEIRWLLAHENTSVYLDDEGDWCAQFNTRCKKLDAKQMCTVYEKRPKICRNHTTEFCEANTQFEGEVMFTEMEQFDSWLAKQEK